MMSVVLPGDAAACCSRTGTVLASADAGSDGRRLDVDTARWLASLGGTGPVRERAIGRLHEMLLRIARAESHRRGAEQLVTGLELDDLAHRAADDAVLAIMTKLAQFRGESRFTTWAYKFVILEVSAKLGRRFWQRPAVTLAGTTGNGCRTASQCGPMSLPSSAI
jgi:RNA polymerase sigma-70 factor, ECF subfamily